MNNFSGWMIRIVDTTNRIVDVRIKFDNDRFFPQCIFERPMLFSSYVDQDSRQMGDIYFFKYPPLCSGYLFAFGGQAVAQQQCSIWTLRYCLPYIYTHSATHSSATGGGFVISVGASINDQQAVVIKRVSCEQRERERNACALCIPYSIHIHVFSQRCVRVFVGSFVWIETNHKKFCSHFPSRWHSVFSHKPIGLIYSWLA